MMSSTLPITAGTLITAAQMVLGYLAVLFVGARLLPGLEREGYPLPGGGRKRYQLTGMTLFFLLHIGLGVATLGFGVSLTPVVRHFWSILVVANVVAVAITVALFVTARVDGAAARSSLPRELWMGRELNPTWLGVDLKMFLYQPSLLGVYLIVLSFAYAQRDLHGVLTPQMMCLVAFWFAYLFTHYVKEEFMLSTWDILSENLGFMLVWGDLVYVPFLYSLPCWWLVDDVAPLATWQWLSLSLFFAVVLCIFRDANWQKERFKRDRGVAIWGRPAEALGGSLLVSGWWGVARKINYAGEIGVYVAFALTTGAQSPVPYLLPLSLVILLVQRAARDDRKCRAKYGELWRQYCARVRYRIVPFVY
jgi:Delta14-sterol reductase